MDFKKVSYGGWPNCYRLSNSILDLVLTADVGPRIIRFGFCDGVNEFKEFPEQIGQTGGDEWRAYGGHRLWHSPEAQPRTYFPDNFPVTVERHGERVHVAQPMETTTGIQKELDIRFVKGVAQVLVNHRLTNLGLWPVELSVWCLSVMQAGGVGILPLPPRGVHSPQSLLPSNTMGIWVYTDMSDARWTWGRRFILLQQDSRATTAQKVGLSNPEGWAAYARGKHLFLKQVTYQPGVSYPDMGCSVELFTNRDMQEIETLSPLTKLDPGQSVEHLETWTLLDGVPQPHTEAEVEKHVLPAIQPFIG